MRIPLSILAALLLTPTLVISRQTLAQEPASPSTPTVAPSSATPERPATKGSGGSVSPPVVLNQIEPEISPSEREAVINRKVLVGLIVDTRGRPLNVHVLHGDDIDEDLKAVDAVSQYIFKPAMQDGRPISVKLVVEVNFRTYLAPVVKHAAAIQMTDEARRNKAKGVILVGLTVDEQGNPQDVHILHGFGMGMDQQAIEAVKNYKFAPFKREGKVMALQTSIEIKFKSK